MNIRICLGLFAATLVLSQNIFAHGDDKLGPHNGLIRMPGAYHVEVIQGKDALDIMLLDVNFKNPTVLNSHIKVKIKSGNNAYSLRCESMDNYFSCPINEKMLSRTGKLEIESARLLSEGMPVEYPLPLRLEKEKLTA